MTEEGKATETKITETITGKLGEADFTMAGLPPCAKSEYWESIL